MNTILGLLGSSLTSVLHPISKVRQKTKFVSNKICFDVAFDWLILNGILVCLSKSFSWVKR